MSQYTHTLISHMQFTLLLLLLLSCGTAEWQAHQSQCNQKAEQFQHHLSYCRASSVLEIVQCSAGKATFIYLSEALFVLNSTYEVSGFRGCVINMLSVQLNSFSWSCRHCSQKGVYTSCYLRIHFHDENQCQGSDKHSFCNKHVFAINMFLQ